MSHRPISTALVCVLFLMIAGYTSRAGADTVAGPRYQMIVFETKNCFYCDHFRYAVAPVYEQSRLAKQAPLHYVDARQTDTRLIGLAGPITVAPTTVLTRDGKEIARIAGVTAPDAFLVLVESMMD